MILLRLDVPCLPVWILPWLFCQSVLGNTVILIGLQVPNNQKKTQKPLLQIIQPIPIMMCKNKEQKTHIYRTYIISHTIQLNIQRTILTSIIRTMEMVYIKVLEMVCNKVLENGMQHQYQTVPPKYTTTTSKHYNCVSSPTISL